MHVEITVNSINNQRSTSTLYTFQKRFLATAQRRIGVTALEPTEVWSMATFATPTT